MNVSIIPVCAGMTNSIYQYRIAIGTFHLFGGFSIDGTDEGDVLEDAVEKFGEGMLQIVEG